MLTNTLNPFTCGDLSSLTDTLIKLMYDPFTFNILNNRVVMFISGDLSIDEFEFSSGVLVIETLLEIFHDHTDNILTNARALFLFEWFSPVKIEDFLSIYIITESVFDTFKILNATQGSVYDNTQPVDFSL